MATGIRIDELNTSSSPSEDHVVPAMKDGQTVKLTVGQILDLLREVLDPDEVGGKALFAALNLSDLGDPEAARENLGATEIGDALFTAEDAAAARGSLGLGNSATRNVGTTAGTVAAGNDSRITGALQRSGGTMAGPVTLAADPTVAMHAATKQYVDGIVEYGSNANGEYVRFANGVQVCWKTTTHGIDIQSAFGGIYGSISLDLGSWPAAFIAPPARVGLQRGAWGLYSGQAPTQSSAGEIILWRPTPSGAASRQNDIIGIGRWK